MTFYLITRCIFHPLWTFRLFFHLRQDNIWLMIIWPVPREAIPKQKLLFRLLSRHDHHAWIFADIHADYSVEAPRYVLRHLGYRMMNMFVGACSKDAEVGVSVDVDKDNFDSVDNGTKSWSWRWPWTWVGGRVNCIMNCGLMLHDSWFLKWDNWCGSFGRKCLGLNSEKGWLG